MANKKSRKRNRTTDVKAAAANDTTNAPVFVERLSPETIIKNDEQDAQETPATPAPTSLRQASIQRSVREKVNKVILNQIGGAECKQFYSWGWSQRDKFMAGDSEAAKIVKARYETHLRTIGQ